MKKPLFSNDKFIQVMLFRTSVVWLILACAALPAHAQWDQILKGLGVGKPAGLSDGKVVSGLKEALRVGTENAVNSTGRTDGYFRHQVIKILMPEKLQNIEKRMRSVGLGDPMDDFILSMNRAAERAAPRAKQIFWDAVLEMTFDDARKILTGEDTAATDYFQKTTSEELTAAFRPVVEKAMDEAGVTRQYKQLMGLTRTIPFLNAEAVDIDSYVIAKSLDGLFYVLGEEERKIRKNPAARITPLLKEVFGSIAQAGQDADGKEPSAPSLLEGFFNQPLLF